MDSTAGDRRRKLLTLAVLAFGVANAALYSSLLPLWEGFDEAFHYGYVQDVAVSRSLPVLGRASLSDEVWTSLRLVPVSFIVRRSHPSLTTFDEFFALPPAEQAKRRDQLDHLSPALRASHSDTPKNYEVHQAPAAYALLALGDGLWAHTVLPARVWLLRLAASMLCCLAVAAAALYLARGLGWRRMDEPALLFLVFCTQMFYATVCHVANDWLAVPLAVGLLGAAVRFYRAPGSNSGWMLAGTLALGLLTKAYFLAFVPGVFALVVWRAWGRPQMTLLLAPLLSGAWYVRNILQYGSLTGMVESVNGVGVRAVVAALPRIPWLPTIGYMARGSLWTGNNTFSTFSRTTLDLMLLLVLAGIVLVVARLNPAERIVLAGIALFILALVYATAQEYVFRKGTSAGASVWYTQPLLVPVLGLVLAGFARAGRGGKWLRFAMLLLWAYVICATYWVKLIPLYAGHGENANMAHLFDWYLRAAPPGQGILSRLSLVTLLPAGVICGLAGLVTAAALVICGFVVGGAGQELRNEANSAANVRM